MVVAGSVAEGGRRGKDGKALKKKRREGTNFERFFAPSLIRTRAAQTKKGEETKFL